MTNTLKKLTIGLFAAIFAVSLAIPTMSAAETEPPGDAPDGNAENVAPDAAPDGSTDPGLDAVTPPAIEAPVAPGEGEAPGEGAGDEGQTPADDCVITLEYCENVTYQDPEKPPTTDDGRRLLGIRTLAAQEGDVLDVWDVAVNIPGYFFFDAWPAKLTVSTDPAQNVVQLFYVRLWNSEYTVNYYLMTGANLAADNWGEALAPDDVRFTKMGSQTFTGQPFDSLVEGDAYEYKLDGTYVIDTYPAQIRLGLEPDDNVINVLYTPESANDLPDGVVKPDEPVAPPTGGGSGGAGGGNTGGTNDGEDNGNIGSGDGNTSGNGDEPSKPTLPGDTTLDKDDIDAILPDDAEDPGIHDDFVGPEANEDGTIDITDEMLDHPVNKAEAQKLADANRTGVSQGAGLAQTGDSTMLWVLAFVVVAAAAIVGIAVFMNRRRKDDPAA